MTSEEFNEKWNKYLEDGFYGMAIEHPQVIEYLDEEFTKEVILIIIAIYIIG